MDINFSTSRNAVVLLGDNACGKSTVLDSIAFMAGPLLERLLPGTAKDLTRTDVHYDREGRAAPYLEVMAWFEAGAPARSTNRALSGCTALFRTATSKR